MERNINKLKIIKDKEISKKCLEEMDQTVLNLKNNKVSFPVDLSDF